MGMPRHHHPIVMILVRLFPFLGCNCGAANCPWTPSAGYQSASTPSAPLGNSAGYQSVPASNSAGYQSAPASSLTPDQKRKHNEKGWPTTVKKAEPGSPRGGYSSAPGNVTPGHATPGPEMKPTTYVKQEPVSPGASGGGPTGGGQTGGGQTQAYANLKAGKRETPGKKKACMRKMPF